jgi:hypothetical protein
VVAQRGSDPTLLHVVENGREDEVSRHEKEGADAEVAIMAID